MAAARRSFTNVFAQNYCLQSARTFSSSSNQNKTSKLQQEANLGIEDEGVPTSGISRPLSNILKDLNKKVPETLLRHRTHPDGFSFKYIPWHILNRIMNLHSPGRYDRVIYRSRSNSDGYSIPFEFVEWSGEVRSINYSSDGKSVSVVYRVTLYGTDAEIFRESTGSASTSETGYGDPVQKAEAMAFRRACARFGLGLHLYHEEMD